jgi:hypothetical protein
MICSSCRNPGGEYVCGQPQCLRRGTVYCERCRELFLTYTIILDVPQFVCNMHDVQVIKFTAEHICKACYRQVPKEAPFKCWHCRRLYCASCKKIHLACTGKGRYSCAEHAANKAKKVFSGLWNDHQDRLFEIYGLPTDLSELVRKYSLGF